MAVGGLTNLSEKSRICYQTTRRTVRTGLYIIVLTSDIL
jgi:hypothetical protein